MKVKGIVLAGGKSSRFGEDKALQSVNGVRMIEKSAALLESLKLSPVVITSAARDYSFLGCRIENDLIPEKGPLGGLYTAGSLFPSHSLLVLTCDMPALSPPLLKQLLDQHEDSYGATVFLNENGRRLPFPGIYEARISDLLLESIGEAELSLHDFFKRISVKNVLPANVGSTPFLNVNTKQDLQSLSSQI